jgi:hypothetical protein
MSGIVRRICAIVAVLSAAALAFSSPASASAPASASTYQPPQVAWVSDVLVGPHAGQAYVLGLYRCFGGREGTHLWVSVKQGPGVKLPDHTSSADAASWYDTNWNFATEPAGLTANCNGHWQLSPIVLKPEQGPWGPLKTGTGYVQFCLFDSTAPPGDTPSQGFAYNYGFKRVFAL